MSYQNVDLYVFSNENPQTVLSNVAVKVMSGDGTLLYTLGTTDDNGHVGLLLPSEMSPFQVRLFKFGYAIKNPQILLVADGSTNIFDFYMQQVAPPVPTDARLCTAFGYFRNVTGRPAANVRMHFISKFKPVLLDGSAVVTERIEAVTDDDGYAQIDLIRNGMYDVTIAGTEDYTRKISVPDQPNVNLPDLLFPVVTAISFSPAIPATMSVGGPDVVLTPQIASSDGNILGPDDFGQVQWSSSDSNILAVMPAGGKLTLRPLAAGTAQVIATRSDTTIVRIPEPGIAGVPVAVTVQ